METLRKPAGTGQLISSVFPSLNYDRYPAKPYTEEEQQFLDKLQDYVTSLSQPDNSRFNLESIKPELQSFIGDEFRVYGGSNYLFINPASWPTNGHRLLHIF